MSYFGAIKPREKRCRSSLVIEPATVIPAYLSFTSNKMIRSLMKLSAAIAILAIFLCLVGNTEANYKNAPMNGIMFGKRGPSEYDSRGKTFTALCEIATEACQTWFPTQESK